MNDIEIVKRELKKRSQGQNFFGEVCHIAIGYIDNLENTIKEKQTHLENLQAVNEELEKRIAIMSEGGWNPVDKKLPTEYGKYWVYTKSGKIFQTEFRPDEEYKEEPFYQWGWKEPEAPEGWVSFYFDDGEHYVDEITHWMYCFEPPKEGEQEAQQDYERNVEYAQYCERYEPTYNPEDGSM